jgi:protease I
VPAASGLLRGRATAGFPPLKVDMEQAGATFVDAPDVVDGAVVSCRGWPDLPEWARAFTQVLERASVPAGQQPGRPPRVGAGPVACGHSASRR